MKELQLGVLKGYDAGMFRPYAPVSLQPPAAAVSFVFTLANALGQQIIPRGERSP